MDYQIKEGSVWVFFFINHIIWATASQFSKAQESMGYRLTLNLVNGAFIIAFFAALHIVLGLEITIVLSAFLVLCLLYYLPIISCHES